MGNCQAIDAAALVIQHPNGRIERLYWPVAASEVMRMNPGHYVSLIIPLPNSVSEDEHEDQKTVRFTRVKLLRPTDTLALGHAYRLVTSEGIMISVILISALFFFGCLSINNVLVGFPFSASEVMKVLRAKKYAKTKQQQRESSVENSQTPPEKPISASKIEGKSDRGNANQVSIYLQITTSRFFK